MSLKKWQQRPEKKGELEEQEQQIGQQFKTNKINKEFGQISGEKLFQPITKRLDKAATKDPEPAEEEEPDYGMDEFDRLNPFDEDFRPDAETPPPTPAPSPPPTPPPEKEEEEDSFEDAAASPPPEEKRKTWAAAEAPSFLKSSSESTDLVTAKQLITKFGKSPGYRVKSGKFQGKSVKDLEKIRDEILMRRGQLREATPGPLDDNSWEIEGSGVGSSNGDKLINQLYVSLGSIRAGNTSTKLRKRVVGLLKLLTKHGVINESQQKKILII